MKAILASDGDLSFLDSIHYPVITIEKNTMTFISGKSGCGKSTYLRLLNRTLLPSKGRLYFEGEDVTTLPVLDYRRRVLLVPQEVFLLDATIWDNFKAFYAACDEMAPDNATMEKYLHLACVDFELTRACQSLSGGERQRVFLAIYLSRKPEVLLLDEPTAALDAETSTQLFTNIKAYAKEESITVVCVCHARDLVEEFADTIIELGEGYEQ